MKISPLCSLVAASLLVTSLPAYSQNAAAPNPATGDTKTATGDRGSTDVGLSKHDGITVSGADAFITRNGVTQKIAKDIKLEATGVTVRPDGTAIMADGTKITIRPDQLLTLDGKLINAPVARTAAPVPPGSSTTNAGAPGIPTPTPPR